MNSEKLIFGCWYDWVSNVVVFTRNGKSLGSPYYVGPSPDTCKCSKIDTNVNVYPKCPNGQDMVLPGIDLQFNYGQTKFQYDEDLKGIIPTDPKRFNVTCPLLEV